MVDSIALLRIHPIVTGNYIMLHPKFSKWVRQYAFRYIWNCVINYNFRWWLFLWVPHDCVQPGIDDQHNVSRKQGRWKEATKDSCTFKKKSWRGKCRAKLWNTPMCFWWIMFFPFQIGATVGYIPFPHPCHVQFTARKALNLIGGSAMAMFFAVHHRFFCCGILISNDFQVGKLVTTTIDGLELWPLLEVDIF